MAKKRKPQPLAVPPQSSTLRSRKRARQVTTLFHKYTQERDAAVAKAKAAGYSDCIDDDDTKDSNRKGDSSTLSPHQIHLLAEIKRWDVKLSEIGGREEYQRASQMNTSLFSTSKWVLGILGRIGWLNGLPPSDNTASKKNKKEKIQRRNIRLLEVGAINTQLIDASERTRIRTNHTSSDTRQQDGSSDKMKKEGNNSTCQTEHVYHLDVKAIDIRSTDPRIQQLDFFGLPLPSCNNFDTAASSTTSNQEQQAYDVIVNSMVINCVTTPAQRGKMLCLCCKQLRPGGMCFLTLPKLCLIQSKFMCKSYFEEILKAVGFEIIEDMGRESPKISFFVLKRPKVEEVENTKWNDKFTKTSTLNRGRKYRNTFAVTLNKEEVGCI